MPLQELKKSPLRNTLTEEDIKHLENHKLFEIYLKRNGIKGLYEYFSFRKEDMEKRKIAVIEFSIMYKYYLQTQKTF
ncbi:hypothetical protein IJU97_03900 [bacterium]|nr:hypothetical protein [bacterium]